MSTTPEELTSFVDVDIAKDGNVVLVVGLEERRLRLSASLLANVSKVFRAMFGPNFSEGQDLGNISSGPKEVHMPEGNADAIEIICSMMHFRSVPREVGPDLMLHIAITADKFDCGIVLQHASILWLDPRTSSSLHVLWLPRTFSTIPKPLAKSLWRWHLAMGTLILRSSSRTLDWT
jgi:hypothetical protein